MRDVFDAGGGRLLIVATDRLSAFDVVFPSPVPGKGRALTQIAALWFRASGHIVPNHFISDELDGLGLPPGQRDALAGRSMLVRRAERIDFECIVRGYLAGSAWKAYLRSGEVCGIPLPEGLNLNSQLPEPIFTPSIKVDDGHDADISEAEMAARLGEELTARLKTLSLELYRFGEAACSVAGLILADTKFEFGLIDGEPALIDEAFTPDSSRMWPVSAYQVGRPIDSLDKQPIRDYVEQIGWNKRPPAPELPREIIEKTQERYETVLRRLQAVLG